MITLSMYARIYNWESPYWLKNRRMNLTYLKNMQNYFNDLLKLRGKVYLSEVYEKLGFPIDDVSRMVGWRYREDNVIGDNYIDFGLPEEYSYGECDILLDFNVDGVI